MPFLNSDVLLEIFRNLVEINELGAYSNAGLRNIYSCIFVCHQWCDVAMPILWGQPFHFLESVSDDEESMPRSSDKLLEMYFCFLNDQERENLLANGIDISLVTSQRQQSLYYGENAHRESDLNDDGNAITQMRKPKYPYVQYLKSLSYITLCTAVEMWCQDLDDIMVKMTGEELIDDAEDILLHTILNLFYNRGAKLSSLSLTINNFLDKRTIALRRFFVDDELRNFFAPIKSLEFSVMYTAINDFLITLSETCRQLNHISVHTLWSRHHETPGVRAFERSFNALISAQTSLTSFHLGECKGYTHVFLPALYSCIYTLRHLSFESVDFRYCEPWKTIAECRNIMSLSLIQCSNVTSDMVQPVINSRHTRDLDIFYLGDGLCREFTDWMNNINGKATTSDGNNGGHRV
ncbi:8887_t:CDS:2 [Acaulospora morrowiae]|uniref:8887_t:CDS:1 n=1 Tax=Acaulospora morrowiae TaxID=94023 RepID=A0A9N8WN58_9GLOM|nr:8887_t:CDS:2 [Acaulospora morrowiae]